MIKTKNLDDLLVNDLKGKTVYLRADLNLPTINGKVTDTTRIKSILPTIKELKKNKCKIVILSHFGRPKGSFNKKMSLKIMMFLAKQERQEFLRIRSIMMTCIMPYS